DVPALVLVPAVPLEVLPADPADLLDIDGDVADLLRGPALGFLLELAGMPGDLFRGGLLVLGVRRLEVGARLVPGLTALAAPGLARRPLGGLGRMGDALRRAVLGGGVPVDASVEGASVEIGAGCVGARSPVLHGR